jgi:hypothetical protein
MALSSEKAADVPRGAFSPRRSTGRHQAATEESCRIASRPTLTNDFTHRNHYIPQRYQQGFANDAGKVWLFDRKTFQYRDGAPVNIGVQRDFYTTINGDGVENDSVEKLLATLEGAVWPVIDRLDRRVEEIALDDRVHLALFVAFMRTRTPAFDQMSNNLTNVMFQRLAKARSPTPEVVAKDYARATGKTIEMDQAREIFDAIHSEAYFVKTPRQNNIKIMLDLAVPLGDAILAMDWTIFWTTPDSTFVTSDNPFIVVPPLDRDPAIEGTGPLSPGATNLIPLSSKSLLCARKDGSGQLRFVKANRDFMRSANRLVAAESDRFLIARDEALLKKLVKITKADQWKNTFMPSILAPGSTGE